MRLIATARNIKEVGHYFPVTAFNITKALFIMVNNFFESYFIELMVKTVSGSSSFIMSLCDGYPDLRLNS